MYILIIERGIITKNPGQLLASDGYTAQPCKILPLPALIAPLHSEHESEASRLETCRYHYMTEHGLSE